MDVQTRPKTGRVPHAFTGNGAKDRSLYCSHGLTDFFQRLRSTGNTLSEEEKSVLEIAKRPYRPTDIGGLSQGCHLELFEVPPQYMRIVDIE